MPALLRALSRFFTWWGGELAALVPVGLRVWWRESDRIVMLSFDGTRAVFERPEGACREQIYTVELGTADPSLYRVETSQRLLQVAGRNFRLLLCLPPDQVLQRTLTLPLAVEENLRQALSFELDRYTPFRPEQVYFDFRVIERDVSQKRLSVELAAVPKSTVDQGVARAAALGLAVNGAVLAAEVEQHAGDCRNFLPDGAKTRRPSARQWLRAGMAAVSVALLAVLLAIPLWQKRAAAISLLDPVAQARAASRETDALRDRLRKQVEEHNFLPNKKWESYSTLQVLEELSKLLPDDTFVMQFDFDGKTVQIQGDTGSSTSLLEILEVSPLFKDVGFKSQLTKLQGTPYDRFHISATLEAAPKPTPPASAPEVVGIPTAQVLSPGQGAGAAPPAASPSQPPAPAAPAPQPPAPAASAPQPPAAAAPPPKPPAPAASAPQPPAAAAVKPAGKP